MKWLRRLLYYRTVKGLEYRLKSLEDMMEMAQEGMSKKDGDYNLWSRLYWDSYSRHDEVAGALGYMLQDWDYR